MKRTSSHLARVDILTALASGRRKAQLFLIEAKTLDESSLLLRFITNSSQKEYEMKKIGCENLRIGDLVSDAMSPTLAKNLEKKAGVETLQDLLVSDTRMVRSALAEEEVCLREIILAMVPNRTGSTWAVYTAQVEPNQPFV